MKKLMIGLLSLGLITTGGAAVYAQSDAGNGEGLFNFGQMSKIMEQHHPDQSKEELRVMYNDMHGTNGAAPSANFTMGEMHDSMHGDGDFAGMHEAMTEEDMDKMVELMEESNGPVNFGQMKKVMKEVHPDFTDKQIKEMYQAMHGTNGAEPRKIFSDMK
ncbi:hypothetical protein BBEV_2240 [Salisediminibacterium beveridgei]|uniref:Uncharacterized protein n=2 Tax=Salisediminibacterium beveridgei TaxID=632773 RepID=A0A1D7QXB6_9BACI|nr:hypothetical protein BBEV_2240 [Salisediminibacterium beveridgei]